MQVKIPPIAVKRWIQDLRLSKSPYRCQEHLDSCRSCMQYNRQRNQAKRKIVSCLKDRENELACTDNASTLFKALLGYNFQLADKTLDLQKRFEHSMTIS